MRVYWDTFTKKWVKPPKGQFPTGSRVYKGFQGSGKTLSMCKYALDVAKAYPNCQVFANFIIKGIDNFDYIKDDEDLKSALSLRNGTDGVLVLLDEAHLYFGKKSGISLDVLTAISQQRKDRRRIVFSSQIWEELDISLRKQVKEIVSCRSLFNMIQINTISDGETLTYDKLQGAYVAKKIRTEIFKHNELLYNSYDTYQKIITNEQYSSPASSHSSPIIYESSSPRRSFFSFSRKSPH
ncbi:hypothetical protein IJJ39_01470 [Candidatus Saccharibacteria bacterium]|nr:hypothetical protein [Candidatus Saccharibacteria bacterium]